MDKEKEVYKKMQTALFYMSVNRFEDAKKVFKAVLQIEPNLLAAQNMYLVCLINTPTSSQELEQTARALLARNSEETLAHFALGKAYDIRVEYDKAIEHFEFALSREPENVDYLCGLAFVLWKSNQYQKAMDLVDRALSINPESTKALTYKSHFSTESFDFETAKENIGKALSNDPMDWALHAQSGQLALKKMDHKNAQKHFKEAIRLNPHNADVKDDYLNGLLAENPAFRFLFSKYWIFNEANFAVRPMFSLMLVVLMAFYKDKLAPDSIWYPMAYWLIMFSLIIHYLHYLIAPAYRLFKSKQLWGRYYRPFWCHQTFVQTSVQLAIIVLTYYWYTDDFRGATSAFVLIWYAFLTIIIFLQESIKLRKIYTWIFGLIYCCATVNLLLDFIGISILPIEMMVSFGWLLLLILAGSIDEARKKWPSLNKYF